LLLFLFIPEFVLLSLLCHALIFNNYSVVDPHHFDADPDSTFDPDEDPDSDFYLMRIRIQLITLMWIWYLMRMRIQVTKLCGSMQIRMWIRIHSTGSIYSEKDTPKYTANEIFSKQYYNILSEIMQLCSLSAVSIRNNIFPKGIMKLQ
jgi:hypothetical protein